MGVERLGLTPWDERHAIAEHAGRGQSAALWRPEEGALKENYPSVLLRIAASSVPGREERALRRRSEEGYDDLESQMQETEDEKTDESAARGSLYA